VGGFAHVVAGSFEAFMLVVSGQLDVWRSIGFIAVPVLLGNIAGGTVLFTLISHAQVAPEM
jgi:formate/nitrite transporter FocA (FNT family)